MIVFSNNITPRLQYILKFIEKNVVVTDKKEEFSAFQGCRINYSDERIDGSDFWIRPDLLLFERSIVPQNISVFETNGYKAFFKTDGDFPFDIFAASFYLLTRYEEYLPHKKDDYGRYDHKQSLAFKENFLHLPLINIWLQHFRKALGLPTPASQRKRMDSRDYS